MIQIFKLKKHFLANIRYYGEASGIDLMAVGNGLLNLSSNPKKLTCILHNTNTLRKVMNLFSLQLWANSGVDWSI